MLLFGLQRWHSWLCAQRLPSSTPSPISHTHTHTNQTPSVAAPSSSSLQCGAPRHLHIHDSPCTRRHSFRFISAQFSTNFTPAVIRLSLVSLQSDTVFPPYAFLCQQSECLVLRGTPSSNPLVLTGGCNSTTELSSLTCVLHINTSCAATNGSCSRYSRPITTSKH